MVSILKKNRLAMVGAIIGALSGWLYWKYVGCSTGGCAITSKPLNSAVYFAILFGLIFSLFECGSRMYKEEKKQNKEHGTHL